MITSSNPIAGVTTAPPAAPPAAGGSVMGKDEFLRLLVTQLSKQDPLNPMDGQAFAAQLAQFSSVEQLININEMLSAQADMQGLLAQNINHGVAAGLIGKAVTAAGDQVALPASGDAPVRFRLGQAASRIEIDLRNEAGEVVRTIKLDGREAGDHDVDWDGTATGGGRLPEGTYTVSVRAFGPDDAPVAAAPFVHGRVDRVSFGQDGIRLWIGNLSLPLGAVESVS